MEGRDVGGVEVLRIATSGCYSSLATLEGVWQVVTGENKKNYEMVRKMRKILQSLVLPGSHGYR